MLQVAYILENIDDVKRRLQIKNFNNLDIIDQIIAVDASRKSIQNKHDTLKAQANELSKEIGGLYKSGKAEDANALKAKVGGINEQVKEKLDGLRETQDKLQTLLVEVPNLPSSMVPAGKTPEDNVVEYEVNELPQLPENALSHWELAEKYSLIDFETGTKLAGAGFPLYTGRGAKLQRALIAFFLDEATAAGYLEVLPPLMVNEETAYGTGSLPDKEGQMYHVTEDNLYLIPTAEVPVTNILRDALLEQKDLPKKYTAYSSCFRREAGSYGKDVRGLNRLHQFEKIEIVQFTEPSQSYLALEDMKTHVEGLLQKLELPYRILRLCGGDMSFTSALTFDFETWSAAQKRWLEVSSVSNFEDFQSNRMKIRFRPVTEGGEKVKPKLVHTLNGSALALPRIVATLLENHQTLEGIVIPKALQKYTGFGVID